MAILIELKRIVSRKVHARAKDIASCTTHARDQVLRKANHATTIASEMGAAMSEARVKSPQMVSTPRVRIQGMRRSGGAK